MEKPRPKQSRNRWSFCRLFIAAVLSAVLCCTAASAALIRVGVAVDKPAVTFKGSARIKDARGRSVSVSGTFTVQAHNGSVRIKGKNYASPVTLSSRQPLVCDGRPYEGDFRLTARGGRVTAVNSLDVEKYLRGVLGFEVNPKWHLEVLKAQAVISRTFALKQLGRHNSAGFDVCPTDHCQIYRGTAVSNTRTDTAISQTRGQVVTYGGKLAQTYFCSDSGGATADVRDVWGGSIPYLTVRREPFPSQSPKSNWQTVLTEAEIRKALTRKGLSVGTVRSVSIVKRDSAGRAVSLKFTGTSGSSVMSSAAFRTLVGTKNVPSTFFDFSPLSSAPSSRRSAPQTRNSYSAKTEYDTTPLTPEQDALLESLIHQKRFSAADRVDMLMYPERRMHYLKKALGQNAENTAPQLSSAPPRPSLSAAGSGTGKLEGGKLTLYGRGWGHGIGLSQWGAKAMAENGWSAVQILQFYFPGTKIQKR